VCFGYERGWEAQRRNDTATEEIRRLFARYRAEAERARTRPPAPRRARPQFVDLERRREREPALH
jgi:hypothetical protein